ncbi:hypothetical protein N0V95_010190, partial [Ascochyta clinopodiicola]
DGQAQAADCPKSQEERPDTAKGGAKGRGRLAQPQAPRWPARRPEESRLRDRPDAHHTRRPPARHSARARLLWPIRQNHQDRRQQGPRERPAPAVGRRLRHLCPQGRRRGLHHRRRRLAERRPRPEVRSLPSAHLLSSMLTAPAGPSMAPPNTAPPTFAANSAI